MSPPCRMCSTPTNIRATSGSKWPWVSEMTPIFIGGPPRLLSGFGFFGRIALRFRRRLIFVFLFPGFLGFERVRQFHRARKQAGEQAAAQQSVAEKLPRLRPACRSTGQGLQPAGQGSGILGVAE